jgi:antitoxin component YwqK of YwqJK toxin-antitoxin module
METRSPAPDPFLRRRWLAAAGACLAGLVLVAVWYHHRPTPSTPGASAVTPDASQSVVPTELSRTNLVLESGRLRLPGTSTPFTGFMLEHYPDGTLRSRSAVSNGLLHGLSHGYHTNGQVQVTEHFREGVSHGLRTKWYLSGAKQSEASIADGQLQGAFQRWHENGQLAEQAEFSAGQPTGVSMAYFPSGYLKARVTLHAGDVAERHSWKDGERKP